MGVSLSSNWSRATAPHVTSVRVTPAVAIGASSIATATVLDTLTPHHLVSGDTATIAGHLGSTPAVDGAHVVTVVDATHVSIPLAVTVAGAGGTITRTIAVEPLTVAQAKVYARLSATDTSLDGVLPGFLRTARSKLQQDTGIVLLTEVYDVSLDALPAGRTPIALPVRPVPSITSFSSTDAAGAVQTLAATNYVLDVGSEAPIAARLALSTAGAWPTDLRSFQPYVLRIVAGWSSIAAIPAPLVDAIGFLIDHIVNKDALALDLYEATIAPYRPVCVA